jgi:uncharacterized FlgJ-related protein
MGVGAAAVAGYAWWRYWSQSASEPAPVKSTAPALPREDVIRFFQDLTERMQQVIVHLAEKDQAIRSNPELRKSFSMESIQELLLEEFEDTMKQHEAKLYEERGFTEEQIKNATETYAEDEDFKKVVTKMQQLYGAMRGEPQEVPEVPAELTAPKLLAYCRELFDSTSDVMEECVKCVSASKPESQEVFQRMLNEMFVKRVDDVRVQMEKKYAFSQEVVQQALVQYLPDPHFRAEYEALRKRQGERFAQMGLFVQPTS